MLNNLEKTLTSVEVADMVGKDHKELLRDIRRYISQLGQSKIAQSEFFSESEYINSQNKRMPCYKVTKNGCEFIAHKLTGVKGTEFTAKYINKFHEMEQELVAKVPRGKELIALALVEAQKTIEEYSNSLIGMNKRIEELEPKANYVDKILESKATVTTTQIAQDYGMSARALNKVLCDMRIQRKVNGQWILYTDFVGQGYVHSKTVNIVRSNGMDDVVMNTEWTQKGRLFLYERLKDYGYIPMIEL